MAKGAAKTIGKIAKNEGVRSAGRYLKKEAGRAAINMALEALDGDWGRREKEIKIRDKKHFTGR